MVLKSPSGTWEILVMDAEAIFWIVFYLTIGAMLVTAILLEPWFAIILPLYFVGGWALYRS